MVKHLGSVTYSGTPFSIAWPPLMPAFLHARLYLWVPVTFYGQSWPSIQGSFGIGML